jgi:hypothetical protein
MMYLIKHSLKSVHELAVQIWKQIRLRRTKIIITLAPVRNLDITCASSTHQARGMKPHRGLEGYREISYPTQDD